MNNYDNLTEYGVSPFNVLRPFRFPLHGTETFLAIYETPVPPAKRFFESLRLPLAKGCSTSHLGLLPSGKKRETALLGAQNRYVLRLADHQRSSPNCAGWDRLNAMFSIPNLKPYLHAFSRKQRLVINMILSPH